MVRRGLWLVVAMVLACVPRAQAQTATGAQLSGIVTDESAGALPGAEVTVTQTDTGMTRFVITDERGGYVFTNLPVGPYKPVRQAEWLQHLRADRHRPRRRRHPLGQSSPANRLAVGDDHA